MLLYPSSELLNDGDAEFESDNGSIYKMGKNNLKLIYTPSMVVGASSKGNIEDTLSQKTYVGIDFGTSTTVVSVIKKDKDGNLCSEALQIAQPDGRGGYSEQEIVNSVLAWVQPKNADGQLLFGKTAYELKSTLKPNKNVFSSFKMDLGLDIGPTYPDTVLSKKDGQPYTIETAKDATYCFFKKLKKAIEDAVKKENLPNKIEYAISVPASFLTNQRADLLDAIHKAGISISESCLIDEPNAAFLSFFYDNIIEKRDEELLKLLLAKSINILVYDFGAGTCDISILSVTAKNKTLQSKNIAISKFTALGGDNIDRDIAKYLAKNLRFEPSGADFTITENLENTIIARLMPIAEQLKIAMVKWLTTQGYDDYGSLYSVNNEIKMSETIVLQNRKENRAIYVTPCLNTKDFRNILSRYLNCNDIFSNPNNICAPIDDALSKSGIQAEDLYGVLFIGGSNENPLIRTSVMSHLPKLVKSIIPSDLRTHVSRGAALHSVGYHGFGKNFIEPIISEDISIITTGDKLNCLIKASTPVPSKEFTINLKPQYDGQKYVEIPVCLSSKTHLLGLLKFKAKTNLGFKKSQSISVTGNISKDKTIELSAYVDGDEICTERFNPLTISDSNLVSEDFLKAIKKYRTERLKLGAKNIKASTILEVIKAAKKAKMHGEIAEYSIELETLHEEYATGNNATTIAYHAERAGKEDISNKYTKIAVERDEDACSCYNYSLIVAEKDKVKWLRKSLSHNSSYTCSLINLGKILTRQNNSEGPELLRKAYDKLDYEFKSGFISSDDLRRFSNLCEFLGVEDKSNEIEAYENSSEFIKSQQIAGKSYQDKALVSSENEDRDSIKGKN